MSLKSKNFTLKVSISLFCGCSQSKNVRNNNTIKNIIINTNDATFSISVKFNKIHRISISITKFK